MSCETTLKTPVSNSHPGLTRDMLQCFARLYKHWPDRRLTLVWLEDNVVFNVPEVVLQRPVAASRRSPMAWPHYDIQCMQTYSHARGAFGLFSDGKIRITVSIAGILAGFTASLFNCAHAHAMIHAPPILIASARLVPSPPPGKALRQSSYHLAGAASRGHYPA